MFTLECILHRIDNVEIYGGFKKRFVFVRFVDKKGKMQYLKLQLSQERINLIESFDINDEIKITFNLEGRERENEKGEKIIFDSKEIYKIEPTEKERNLVPVVVEDGGLLLPGEKDVELPF